MVIKHGKLLDRVNRRKSNSDRAVCTALWTYAESISLTIDDQSQVPLVALTTVPQLPTVSIWQACAQCAKAKTDTPGVKSLR